MAWALQERDAKGADSNTKEGHLIPVGFSCKDDGGDAAEERAPTLRAMNHDASRANGGGQVAVAFSAAVRRLTPVECERLQGFPDNYSLVPFRGGMTSDSARYRMLGNSMAVPVIHWIAARIEAAIFANLERMAI